MVDFFFLFFFFSEVIFDFDSFLTRFFFYPFAQFILHLHPSPIALGLFFLRNRVMQYAPPHPLLDGFHVLDKLLGINALP